jgi:hypothetical protein
MAPQQAGLMPIVCPVRDEGEYAGIGILTVPVARATEIYGEDTSGMCTYEVGTMPVAIVPA